MIDKIHDKNPELERFKHELIWDSNIGKFFVQISDTLVNFVPFSNVCTIRENVRKIMLIQDLFKFYYFVEKRGIFETLYLIERLIKS